MSAQSFQDPYTPFETNYNFNNQYTDTTTGQVQAPHGANSFGEKISDFLGLTKYDETYNRYLSDLDREYERRSVNSARAWEEWFDSTAVQRRVKDIKDAGLNPWLALQSGNALGGSSASTSTGGSARSIHSGKKEGSAIKNLAFAVIATAKLFTLLG